MTWNTAQFALVRSWTEALLAFGKTAFVRGTVSDVVAWPGYSRDNYSSFTFAFIADGEKVARQFGYMSSLGNEDLDLGASTGPIVFASKKILRAGEWAIGIDKKIQLSELLERLSGQIIHEFLGDIPLPFDESHARLIIEPGYPWPEDDANDFAYWSAKKGKMIRPERPAWLISVEDPDDASKKRIGVNPCLVFPPEEEPRSWPLWAKSSRGQELLVCHTMDLISRAVGHYRHPETAGASLRNCGGFLFPSISIGPVPASSFGPITFVGHMGLVLDGFKPYKAKEPTSWVYAHDAWTVQTRELMTTVAIKLFEELHGHDDYMSGYNIWALGPPAEMYGGPSEGSTPLTSTKELVTAVRQRSVSFPRGMTVEQFDDATAETQGTVNKYPYCEAKGRRVVSLDEFPVLIAPDSLEEDVAVFVRNAKYQGEVIFLPDTLGVGKDGFMTLPMSNTRADTRDYVLYKWSWIVADAIKKLGKPMDI